MRDDQVMGCEEAKGRSAEKGMKWQFSTPAAPPQIALKRGIGEEVLTPFELYTCLLEETSVIQLRVFFGS